MNSLQTSIYDYEEVLYTLAWLSGCDIEVSKKRIVKRAVQLGYIKLEHDKHWHANERNIFRRLKSFKIAFPHRSQIKNLTSILIGFGEMSARSHGDFKTVIGKKFTSFFYEKSLSKVLEELVKTERYMGGKHPIEETGFSQRIERGEFDWKGYDSALTELRYGSRLSTNNYGVAFILELCLKIIPFQYSHIVEKYKKRPSVGILCYPAIEPLMFRDKQYLVPLLKSKNAYLKLLACASVVQEEPFDNQSRIDDNIKMLVSNGIDVGDAIWLSSVKLREHYQNVERIRGQIISIRNEILRCKKYPNDCQKGIRPTQWIDSQKVALKYHEESLIKAEDRLKVSLRDIEANWPERGIASNQNDNLIHLIKNEQLSRALAELIPSKDNQIQILNHVLLSVEKWIGISTQSPFEACEEMFSYSSKPDLERLVNAAKTLILLSNFKGKIIGRFLGNRVRNTVVFLEGFVCRPFMSARKPSLWLSATSRLACIHILAMCVFDEVTTEQEGQVSKIVPRVIENVNLLLKVQASAFHSGDDELFRDLKRITSYIISSTDYTDDSAVKIALDMDLPCDYRLMVIVSNKALIQEHGNMVLEFFENFGAPPIYVDSEYKHFTEWISLLDICIAYCWKYGSDQVKQGIIRIWEQYCPMYGDECSDYVVYARNLYSALSEDGEDRKWLKELDGFGQSNCMNFLKETLEQNQLV